MAYSSIEHMGVVALGFGFGGPLGIAGAFYHMLNHSLNKSLMFFGAGNMMRAYGTKRIGQIRGVSAIFPMAGALWLAGAIAITGAPPFGLFLSEFTIMRAGLQPGFSWAVYFMAVMLIVIFVGFMNHFRIMYYAPLHRFAAGRKAERVVRRADVGGPDRASCSRPVVAVRRLELSERDRAYWLRSAAMRPFEPQTVDTQEFSYCAEGFASTRRASALRLCLAARRRSDRVALHRERTRRQRFHRLALQGGWAHS